jgi:hypothetical protein
MRVTVAPIRPARHLPPMARFLVILGVVLVVVGLAWPLVTKLGLGRLPGDIVVERGNFRFNFPIATSIVLSVILSLILSLFHR